jgi:hypothetical protein
MSPQVTAAIIAAIAGVVTVTATVVTQYLGRSQPAGTLRRRSMSSVSS